MPGGYAAIVVNVSRIVVLSERQCTSNVIMVRGLTAQTVNVLVGLLTVNIPVYILNKTV